LIAETQTGQIYGDSAAALRSGAAALVNGSREKQQNEHR
jgi:hypothetical protein